MWYRDNYVLADPDLDPGDLYLLTTTIGHPLMSVMDYTDAALGLTPQSTSRQARLVTWFCALCAIRIADVVEFDGYDGDFAAEQLSDYQIEWPEVGEEVGTEPWMFYDRLCMLSDAGTALNFIDLMIGEFCREFCLVADTLANSQPVDLGVMAPLLKALALGDRPDAKPLVPIIDRLLYEAGVPLRTERYVMVEEGVGTSTWKTLEVGALSDDYREMGQEDFDEFLNLRESGGPPSTSHLSVPPFTYTIRLAKEPEDE